MSDNIESKAQFPDTPQGWASRWSVEFESARKELSGFRETGERVEDRYLSEKESSGAGLNLFFGDIEHKKALLYGNPPKVRSVRRFADPKDDEGRVAADMQGRLLNSDIQRRTDGFRTALALARDDRLLPGLGVIRERYVVEMEDVPEQPAQMGPCPCAPPLAGFDTMPGMDPVRHSPDRECPQCGGSGQIELAPAVPATQRKRFEDVETDYINWRDFLWGAGRVWDEVPWVAFRAELTREKLHERFDATIAEGDAELGARLVDTIGLNAKEKSRDRDGPEDPWARAAVWEIWCKESREVFWYVEGFDRILDRKPDPLGLDNFWPCPRPLFANVTSRKLVPTADLKLHQNLYEAIDVLHQRRDTLIKAVRVAGAFDKNNPTLEHVIDGGANRMYPVDGWAAFQERGGLKGSMEFLSLAEIIQAIEVLTAKLQEAIALKDQAVGIADVMRGQATPGGGVTATERRIQARSASTRQKAAQDEFARFATDAQNIRAEIISKHFDPETIIERSNIMRTDDAPYAQKAAELIKSDFAQFRIEVAADTLAMTDYDAVKAERVEVVGALGGLFQAAAPLVQMAGPQAASFVLEVGGWLMAATPGGTQMEGVFDKFKSMVEQAAQAPKPPPPPDPKLEATKMKAQADMVGAKVDVQKAQIDLQTAKVKGAIDLQKLQGQAQVEAIKATRPPEEFPA